jgi:hypothetical protein
MRILIKEANRMRIECGFGSETLHSTNGKKFFTTVRIPETVPAWPMIGKKGFPNDAI